MADDMVKVVYVAEFDVLVDAPSKPMAIHEAGKIWPNIQEAVEGWGANVKIKSIHVELPRKADS